MSPNEQQLARLIAINKALIFVGIVLVLVNTAIMVWNLR